MREIKFRVWDGEKMVLPDYGNIYENPELLEIQK